MNNSSQKNLQVDWEKIKDGFKNFCTMSFISLFLATNLSNPISNPSVRWGQRVRTNPLTSFKKNTFHKFKNRLETQNKNKYRSLRRSQVGFTQAIPANGFSSSYPAPPVPVQYPKVTDIKKNPVTIGNSKQDFYITTFKYNKIEYWTVLGNASPYKSQRYFEEKLKEQGKKAFPNKVAFNLPTDGDHVFMKPDREAMHLPDQWASVVFVPDFANSNRTNKKLKKYQGEDRRLNPNVSKELNYGMDKLLQYREQDILKHFLDSISPAGGLYDQKKHNYDDFAILHGLQDIFIDGYNQAFNYDMFEYEKWLNSYGIDITKPESVIAHYIELSLNAQELDWENIQSYPFEIQRSKNSVFSPEYYIQKVIEASNYHTTSVRELTRFVSSSQYKTRALSKQADNDFRILDFLENQAKSFYTEDSSFAQTQINSLINNFKADLKKAKQIPKTSKKSKREVLDFCCEDNNSQLGNYYSPKWGRGRAFDDRTKKVKKSQFLGKPMVKDTGTMTKPTNPRKIMNMFNWGITFKIFNIEFRIGVGEDRDLYYEDFNPIIESKKTVSKPTSGGADNGNSPPSGGDSGGGGTDGNGPPGEGGSSGGGADGNGPPGGSGGSGPSGSGHDGSGGSNAGSTGSGYKQVDKKEKKEEQNKESVIVGSPAKRPSAWSLMPDLDEIEKEDLISTR